MSTQSIITPQMQVPITFIYFSNQYINQSRDRWEPINYRVLDKCGMLTVQQERRVPWVLPGSRCVLDEKSTKCHIKSDLTWIFVSAVFKMSFKKSSRPYLTSFCVSPLMVFVASIINLQFGNQVGGDEPGRPEGTFPKSYLFHASFWQRARRKHL